MTRASRLVATLAAALLGAVAGVVALSGPAQAAACSDGSGYTVVVDSQQLGSGSSTTCVSGSGRERASTLFGRAGVGLQYASNDPGFVCRVNGAPSNAGCVNTPPDTAYWSLWWSTGNGTWTYASSGVSGQKVPQGGWVAWSWQGQKARKAPGVSPVTPRTAAPRPTTKPTARPTTGTGSTGGSDGGTKPRPGASASASARASASASPSTPAEKKAAKKAKARAKAKVSASASAAGLASDDSSDPTSDDAAQAASESGDGPGGLAWVAILVLLALGVSGGVVAWRRRASADL